MAREEETGPAVAPRRRVRRQPRPGLALVTGFAALIAIGSVLLLLPISSASGDWTNPIVALFTATSAVCVTGLVVVDTATYWSPFGQVVVLALIQLGGLGIMSFSTLLLLLLVGRGSALHDRIAAQETLGVRDLGSVRPVLRLVVVFTVLAEVTGWMVLTLGFLTRYADPDAGRVAWPVPLGLGIQQRRVRPHGRLPEPDRLCRRSGGLRPDRHPGPAWRARGGDRR